MQGFAYVESEADNDVTKATEKDGSEGKGPTNIITTFMTLLLPLLLHFAPPSPCRALHTLNLKPTMT